MLPSLRSALFIAAAALLAISGGLLLAAQVQGGSDVEVEQVTFTGESGARMRALLFRPSSATSANPAPAILAIHGYLNSAEMQGNFATEFARRGYVVLAPDQRGHGASDPPSFAEGFGGPQALGYLRSLPFVDRDNIGLEGHSMGGWAVLNAAAAFPEGYKALVLEGSSVGAPFAPEGSTTFPRNLLVVFGLRDEFGDFMWGAEAPRNTGDTQKMMVTFGTEKPAVAGRLYGNIDQGTARMWLAPFVTHPWLHQSGAGIGPAIQWFDRTLEGGRSIPVSDQIWPWREAGDALALIGVIIFILGMMALAMRLFGIGRLEEAENVSRPAERVGALAALSLIPALTYIPLAMLSEAAIGQNALFRQTFSNQFAFWALINAIIAVLAMRLGKTSPAPLTGGWKVFLVAVLAVLAAYVVVALGDQLLHVNPSWWFFTIRPLTWARFPDFLIYLPFFTSFAVAALYALDTVRPLDGDPAWRSLAVAACTLAGGFLLLLAVQYAVLGLRGSLLLPGEGLRTIMAIGFAVIFVIVGIFGVASRRWTGSVLAGGLVSGLFVTWVLTATQPIGL